MKLNNVIIVQFLIMDRINDYSAKPMTECQLGIIEFLLFTKQ